MTDTHKNFVKDDSRIVILGALLHDIGKFWQRTGQERHLYNEFSKGEVGKTGLHAIWSGEFFRQYVSSRLKELGESGAIAQFHHRPDFLFSEDDNRLQILTQIVQKADHLAARFDRDKRPADDPKGSPTFDRLESVFEQVQMDSGENSGSKERNKYYYPLKPLAISRDIFPRSIEPEAKRAKLTEEYAQLWGQFIDEYEKLPFGELDAFLDSLYFLLQKYTWCIPSATYVDYPSISLFDHSRVAAAIAHCLYKTQDENSEKPFLVINGDISGIQNFIYNPSFNSQELQDGLARRLRGRSFYINLLNKTLADYLISELELFQVNLLWATGGHFMMLAPNTAECRSGLEAAKEKISEYFWNNFRGRIGAIISSRQVSSDELNEFADLQSNISLQMNTAKLQKLSFEINSDEAWSIPIENAICVDTGVDLSANEIQLSKAMQQDQDEDDSEFKPRSLQSLSFDAIGRILSRAQTLQLKRSDEWSGTEGKFWKIPKTEEEAKGLKSYAENVVVEFPELNRNWVLSEKTGVQTGADLCLRLANHKNPNIEFLDKEDETNAARGFELIANSVKTEKDGRKITEFHELAKNSEGADLLGVLRMDVDNLGYLFIRGLAPESRSISKAASLSRMLEWFFAGYLNLLVADKNLYTTYSGGDDLFVVGAWNEAFELAEKVRADFEAFCGFQSGLSISGGLAVVKGKFPIGRAAEEAGQLLDGIAKSAARENIAGDTDKNSLAFLQHKISWEKWEETKQLAEKMIDGIEETNEISRQFIYQLLALYRQHIDPNRLRGSGEIGNKGAEIILLGKLKYSITRNVKNQKTAEYLLQELPEHFYHIPILAGYISLLTRGRSKG